MNDDATIRDVLTRLGGIELPPGKHRPRDDEDFPCLHFGDDQLSFDLFEDGILDDGGGNYAVEDMEDLALGILAVLRTTDHPHGVEHMDAVLVRIADLALEKPTPLRWSEERIRYEDGDEFLRFNGVQFEKLDLYPDGSVLGFNDSPFTLEELAQGGLAILSMLSVIHLRALSQTN